MARRHARGDCDRYGHDSLRVRVYKSCRGNGKPRGLTLRRFTIQTSVTNSGVKAHDEYSALSLCDLTEQNNS